MSELASRARLAILWTTGFHVFRDALQFVLMLVLVRMLPAEAYGQFGFMSTILGFLTLFSFRPFVAHALQVRDDDAADFQRHFTVGLIIQSAVFVAANILAVVLRFMPAYAPIAPLLHVMSLLFLLDLPCEVRVKMLERQLDWRRLRLLLATGIALSAAVSVSLAFTGAGVYALLLPLLVAPAPFIYDLLITAGWRPTWEWDRAAYLPAWRFGASRIFAGGFVSSAQLLESTWLSGVLGFAGFGIFNRALGLSQLACQRTATLVSTSVYPVLTRIAHRSEAYRRASALLLRAVAWTVVPIAVFAGLMATEVVTLLYGGRWSMVVPLLPWAMGAGTMVAVIQPAYLLLLAHDRQDRCLRADAWRLIGTVVILLVCLPQGVHAYLAGLALLHAVSLGLILYWLHEDAAVSFRGVAAALVPPVFAGAIAGAVVLGWTLIPSSSNVVIALAIAGALFFSTYLLVLRLLYRELLEELVGYLPKRRRISQLLLLPDAA
ncbi:MAG: oligosaccharide flippase family protein [Vicinamibacterales bacterium]